MQQRLAIAIIAIAAASLGARLGALHWAGDLLALVVDLYIILGLLLFALAARARAWRWAIIAALIIPLNAHTLTDYQRAAPPAPAAGEPTLRILVYNIYYRNSDLDQVVATVRRYDPDIVFLMEYSHDIQQRLEDSFAAYPHRLIQPSRFTMGLALFSRLPIEEAIVHRSDDTRIPIYEVRMRAKETAFTFVGGHPWPPQPQWGQLHRDQMAAITRVAAGAPQPLIVAGDFNAAPWAYTLRDLAHAAEVRHVRDALDAGKTWFGAPLIGLPLDHVLISDEWRVLAYRYGARGGSDHVPIVVDLRLEHR